MTVGAAQAPRFLPARVRGWAVWTASPALLCCWVVVVALAAGSAAAGVVTTPVRPGEFGGWLVFTGCGAVCVEAVRRAGEPAGAAKDLLSAWTMPVALLLPPVYSLLIPVPLTVLFQLRVRHGLVYRRVYSAASIGLANGLTAVLFHRYLRGDALNLISGGAGGRTVLLLVALGCATVGSAVNVLLIGTVVRLTAPGTTWRELLADREQRVLDAAEICLGVVVTGCWLLTPGLALIMLVPVLMVQRTLTHEQLRAAARTDAKTGLLNARAWQEEANQEIVRALRMRQPVAVLLADLDHFKRINDTHGHLAGDAALTAAVTALTGQLRPYDQLGRFGGDEFTIVLPLTDPATAGNVAERLRAAVAGTPVILAGNGDDGTTMSGTVTTIDLTVSIGVAVLGVHGEDLTDLLTAADHALYRAKQAGRNQIAVAPHLHVPAPRSPEPATRGVHPMASERT